MYQGDYRLVGNELSLFTRKLEAQLRFQRLPWRWQFKTQERTPELEARAGTHFIPLLETPDGLAHPRHDSDRPHAQPALPRVYAVLPEAPLQRASTFILEDFFNHWLGRSCVHSRWCYPDNVRVGRATHGRQYAAGQIHRRTTQPTGAGTICWHGSDAVPGLRKKRL